jgi:hypothetical protein
MLRSMVRPVVAVVLLSMAAPVWAADKSAEPAAPSAAVAAAWAKEAAQQGPRSALLNAMYGSYGALQTLDMVSTVRARNQGAREVNPMMSGGLGQATATKAILAAASIGAVRLIEKKNRKAALVTMIALNAATAAVVMNNVRTTREMSRR